ncbi:MAG: carboxypeptidase regulatory-like domain-containing protein, partial [Candidatus Omnitrophica bacterium]|nr:carboxypeptidase regulatory-like domain-containing protein [Candidatus Omnitrophota bacterium]
MRSLCLSVCSRLMMVLLMLCVFDGYSRAQTVVSGTVRGEETQQALWSVPVTYDDNEDSSTTTMSNLQGEFSFNFTPNGLFFISGQPEPNVPYDGRFYTWSQHYIYLEPGTDWTDYPLRLEEAALISGHVTDGTIGQNPLSGVEVNGLAQNGTEHGNYFSDGAGFYQIRLPEGQHVISVDFEGDYVALPQVITVSSSSDDQTVDLRGYDDVTGVAITGDITNTGGHSVEPGSLIVAAAVKDDAILDIDHFYLYSPFSVGGVETFGEAYDLIVPPFEGYTILFMAVKNETSFTLRGTRTVSAGSGGSEIAGQNFSYNSEGGTISGHVTINGKPAIWTLVFLTDTGGNFVGLSFTDETGFYEMYNVPAGNYNIQAKHSEYGKSPLGVVNGVSNGGQLSNVN